MMLGIVWLTLIRRNMLYGFKMEVVLLLFFITTEEVNGFVWEINKCCQLNEKLDASYNNCIPYDINVNGSTRLPSSEDFWWPPWTRDNAFSTSPIIKHKVLQATGDVFFVFDGKIIRNSHWQSFPDFGATKTQNCYDASDNSSHLLVQKVALKLARLNKCCKKGEEYNVYDGICEKRPGYVTEEELKEETINRTYIVHWFPLWALHNKIIVVRYNYLQELRDKRFGHIGVQYPNVWRNSTDLIAKTETYGLPNEFTRFHSWEETSLQNVSSRERGRKPNRGMDVGLETSEFREKLSKLCFDKVSGTKDIYVQFSAVNTVIKCCPNEEILSSTGHCFIDRMYNLRLKHALEATTYIRDLENIIIQNKYPSQCVEKKYVTKKLDTGDVEKVLHFRGRVDKNWNFNCYDWQKIGDNYEYKEVIGSCPLTRKVRLYNVVRPFGAVTALLLLAAVVAALIRKETRSSAHGRALASHAFCLAASNGIQVIWFFTSEVGEECTFYAYPIYYVMLAGNVWLAVITGNMLYGFKKPLGAVASRRGKDGDGLKHFVVMSAIAWGIPAIFTVVTVTLHQLYLKKKLTTFIAPTFFETRLCINELWDRFNKFPDLLFNSERRFIFVPLVYYYIPVILMVLGNITCVIYVVYKIRTLEKDKAFLHADHQKKSSSTKQSVLLYVKLLLLAGVIEFSLELVAYFQQLQKKDISVNVVATLENSIDFNVVATCVDFVRAVGVLWLCSGWRFHIQCAWMSRKLGEILQGCFKLTRIESSQAFDDIPDIKVRYTNKSHVTHL